MTRGEDFNEKGRCKKEDCSAMSSSAYCDINSKGDILKLHDKCPNPKCNCQKIITLHLIIICLKVDRSKVSFKKFLKEHK